jgi:flavorubredoxin
MHPVELREGVYWVGAVDWDLRTFHGQALSTHRGSSYNAYLIMDERPTLVDTVWAPFTEVLLKGISEIIDPARIEVIVSNHVEADHSGALPAMMARAPGAEVICSARGREGLKKHYFGDWNYKVVKTGDSVKIGRRTLAFVEAPMLHWPDSMFTYLVEDQILMPNDAFGQHIATAFRFDDQVNIDEVMAEAQKYYANILLPFSALVTRKLDEVSRMGIPIKMIAPSHGIIWRENPGRIIEAYANWAKPGGDIGCVIAYDTMWGATHQMAMEIGQGLVDAGVSFKLLRASTTDTNDMIAEAAKVRGLILGSPTVNRVALPDMVKFVHEMVSLRPSGKVGAAFGSYGWSGEAAGELESQLKAMNVAIAADSLRLKWVPDQGEAAACREFGRKVGEAIKGA